jgi:hypothetical protein
MCPPNTDVTVSAIYKCHWGRGSGSGRVRSPGEAQRSTGDRCTVLETALVVYRAASAARLVDRLSHFGKTGVRLMRAAAGTLTSGY